MKSWLYAIIALGVPFVLALGVYLVSVYGPIATADLVIGDSQLDQPTFAWGEWTPDPDPENTYQRVLEVDRLLYRVRAVQVADDLSPGRARVPIVAVEKKPGMIAGLIAISFLFGLILPAFYLRKDRSQ